MKNILFDFDGTLMDTWPGIESTIRAAFRELKIPLGSRPITRELVGMPLVRVFDGLLGVQGGQSALLAQKYRELFPATGMPRSRPFQGVAGMMGELLSRGRALFLVTARNEAITRRMLDEHDMAGSFTWVRGEGEGEVADGKAHMVAEVLERFQLEPGACVMVGDRSYDVQAALANGMQAVGVTYGYGTREELVGAGASRLAGSIAELEDMLVRAFDN